MLDLEVLIGKLLAVDGFAASALLSVVSDQYIVVRSLALAFRECRNWDTHITTGEVTTLKHKFGNHTVEF